jgi:hypothetical protein
MRRGILLLVLAALVVACSTPAEEQTTTTTVPSWALDPGAPAGNAADPDGMGWDSVVGGETWRGWSWRVAAGGPIDVDYLDERDCSGWASRAPTVEFALPAAAGPWIFSFAGDVPVTGWGEEGDEPTGAVLIVREPDGSFHCALEYVHWQYFPGPVVQMTSAAAGTYDVWVAGPEGTVIEGELVIATPEAYFPTTTTTTDPNEPPSEPASTFPPTTT